MVKQLITKNIKSYLAKNPNCILLDVRTKEEWNQVGKPDGDKIGLKTYFLSSQFEARVINENFVEKFKDLNINKGCQILIMCGSGNRSQRAAELLTKEGYNCSNVSDGFRGNGQEKIGWKNNQLPIK